MEEFSFGENKSWTSSAGITRIRFKGYYLRLFTTPVYVKIRVHPLIVNYKIMKKLTFSVEN